MEGRTIRPLEVVLEGQMYHVLPHRKGHKVYRVQKATRLNRGGNLVTVTDKVVMLKVMARATQLYGAPPPKPEPEKADLTPVFMGAGTDDGEG